MWTDLNAGSPEDNQASGITLLGTERFGQEVRSHTGHKGTGQRILSPPRIYECTGVSNAKKEKILKKNRHIYYEVNAYVNTLKTKSTRGQDIANQNPFIAEIFKMFLTIEICCYVYFYLTNNS